MSTILQAGDKHGDKIMAINKTLNYISSYCTDPKISTISSGFLNLILKCRKVVNGL
jgi:hypothetical protein